MRENRDKEFKVALMDREQQTLKQRDNMKKIEMKKQSSKSD